MGEIKYIQLDLNGYCNAKCWYCPVRYEEIPRYRNVKKDEISIIFDKIFKSKYIDENPHIYTSHYNEILLYPYLSDFFKILRKFNLQTSIFSNGTNLTPEKYNLLMQNSDVIKEITLNIPTITKKLWTTQTGLDEKNYVKLISNLNHINKNKNDIDFSIIMVGYDKKMLFENGGTLSKLRKFPDYIKDETLDIEYKEFKKTYPEFNIYKTKFFVDRNSLLEKNNIYSHTIGNILHNKQNKTKIIKCDNIDRLNEVLHINSFGDVFSCCNDYNYDYVFGNIFEEDLDIIWESKKREEVLKLAREKMCSNCVTSTWV